MSAIENLKRKKWLVIGLVLIVMLVMLVALSMQKKKNPEVAELFKNNQVLDDSSEPQVEQLSESVQLQKAIEEQKQADQDYAQWRDDIRVDYPWLNKLPLAGDKYYVYFDIDKKMFVATLYPAAGDDIEQIKNTVVSDLKTKKEIPADTFNFEWVVYQK